MSGISEIGSKNNLNQGTKGMPAFGNAYSPSFGSTTYHDEFVSSHDSGGVTAKQIGLFALVGLAVGAVVALALKKPSAATVEAADATEVVEKVVEYRLAEGGTARKVVDFLTAKGWRTERRARLDAIRRETAEAGVAEVPGLIRRAARFLWIPGRFGESGAVLKGRIIAEEALNKRIKDAERIADAPIREAEALAEASAIADKARLASAKVEETIATPRPAPASSPAPTVDERPRHRGSLAHLRPDGETSAPETILTRLRRERAEAASEEIKVPGRPRRIVRWFNPLNHIGKGKTEYKAKVAAEKAIIDKQAARRAGRVIGDGDELLIQRHAQVMDAVDDAAAHIASDAEVAAERAAGEVEAAAIHVDDSASSHVADAAVDTGGHSADAGSSLDTSSIGADIHIDTPTE